MLKRATIRVASLVCVLAAAGSASGQIGLEPSYPYTGMINGTLVRVRAGRGDPSGANNYYYCAVLDRPAKVTVVGADKGWLMVLPPEGCYSVVLQSAVKVDSTGTKGTVTKREWARAAGTARTLQFTAGHKRLKPGDTVEILGTVVADGFKFYKIKSPEKVYFWIYATLVDKVASARRTPTTGVGVSAPTTRPAGAGATTRPVAAAPKDTDSSIVGVTAAQMKEFRAVQAALRTEYGKPVIERDYNGLIARFKALKFEAGHPLIPFVDYYVKYIEDDVERLDGVIAARKLSDDAAKAQKEFEAARAKVTIDVPAKPVTFDAEGIIAESRMFAGMSAVRKRYIVYDRNSHRLNAYIYSTDPQVDLSKLVGKHIGVFGDSKYDKGLGANVIDVKQTEIIDDKAAVPILGKPTIRTRPKVTVRPVTVKPTTRPGTTTTKPTVKPMPLIDLVPTTKPAGVSKPAPVIRRDRPKPAPIIRPVPAPVAKPKSVGVLAPAPRPEARPKAIEVAKPEPVAVAKPEPVAVAKPEPVAAARPEPVAAAKPEPVAVAKPEPVAAARPEPVAAAKPEPVAVAKPEPVAAARPEPVAVAKPEPVAVARPEPVAVARPEPIAVAKPEPVAAAKPEPVARPRPIDLSKPMPAPLARPKPIRAVGPVPVPVAKPKPIDVAKPIVSPKPRPLPTTRRAVAATAKPAKLINPKPIAGLGPTTRPAASIDTIPAPAKPVDPGDFPMPLPPSGLPLVDVKKTPTTMPANESEFE